MKVGERGQFTIPKPIRDQFGINKDSDIDVFVDGNRICLVKRSEGRKRVASIRGILKFGPGESVDQIIEDMRGR